MSRYVLKRLIPPDALGMSMKPISIVLQNENGPCAFIAVINVLSLRGQLSLLQYGDSISHDDLMSLLAEYLLTNVALSNADERANLDLTMSLLPSLHTGLNMNPQFSCCDQWTLDAGLVLFDQTHIRLYHTMVIDPESPFLSLKSFSYDTCVNATLSNDSDSSELSKLFLSSFPLMSTPFGYQQLKQTMAVMSYGVLFLNNHFSTVFKDEKELYLLVTDIGMAQEMSWEKWMGQGETVPLGETLGKSIREQEHELEQNVQNQDNNQDMSQHIDMSHNQEHGPEINQQTQRSRRHSRDCLLL